MALLLETILKWFDQKKKSWISTNGKLLANLESSFDGSFCKYHWEIKCRVSSWICPKSVFMVIKIDTANVMNQKIN